MSPANEKGGGVTTPAESLGSVKHQSHTDDTRSARQNAKNELAAAAVEYAARGWHVHPVQAGRKEPATRHGFKDATNDPERVARWWTHHPADNIGIACGPSRLLVVDVDDLTALDRLEARGLRLPDTLTQITPRGGLHFIYRAPEWELTNKAGNLPGVGDLPGVDIRGTNGYILAAPSESWWVDKGCTERRPVPEPYRMSAAPPQEPQPCPPWLREPPSRPETRKPFEARYPPAGSGTPEGRLDGLAAKVAATPEGKRNDVLNWAAYTARELVPVLGLDTVSTALTTAGRIAGQTEPETRKTVASGLGVMPGEVAA